MKFILSLPYRFVELIFSILIGSIEILRFMFLIILYSIYSFVSFLAVKMSFLIGLRSLLKRILIRTDGSPDDTISKMELIHLALQNMRLKKSRTIVTVGGMSIGIAAIVFLVSIGFGVQSLVISKVARLDELKQAEVTTSPKSNLFINDDMLEVFQNFPNVEMVLPQISVVGKVKFNNSSTDMAVYGVTQQYLEQSAISPVKGKAFTSNEIDNTYEVITSYYTEGSTDLENKDEVLVGEWIEVEGESDTGELYQISKVVLPPEITDREAVVNRTFLRVLNINEEEALNMKFKVSFIATGKIIGDEQDRIESTETEYTIIGVTPDDSTPIFYVPFIHLRSIGIANFSSAKVVATEEAKLKGVRDLIESQGFNTTSVVDTVAQINSLFSTVRTVLALVGTVALLVAALGMFNTLTVSLLERTREIGLLKAMGMKSKEIRDSFLAESMIMGSLGGLLGIFFGYILGKILEIILSIMAIRSGAGWISIIEIPLAFATMVIIISFLVGVMTGIYPARRATRISALNALRYE